MDSGKSWQQRAEVIHKIFVDNGGECHSPVSTDTSAFVISPLKALVDVASEWHLLPKGKHYGVFGFNMFSEGCFIDKLMIFGDQDIMDDWRSDHPLPNCAQQGWECFAAVSEFDYLFVNIDTSSANCGQTRRIVNNTWKDEFLTDNFESFFQRIENLAHAWKDCKAHPEDDQDVGCEDLVSKHLFP